MSETAFGLNRVGSSIQTCPFEKRPATHWIEIRMLGEDDRPVPWEEYSVRLPNGELVRGYLDEEGLARIEGIENAGTCQVNFPALDKDAWQPIG